MEQIKPISDGANAALPPAVPEPRWDPEKAARRKVRVVKVPYSQDPMKEKTVFEFNGFVYICYAKKTRGRSMIRCLGMAEVEKPRALTPFETGQILNNVKNEIEADEPKINPDEIVNTGAGIKEVVDDDIIEKVVKEAEGDPEERPSDLAVTNFRAERKAEGHGESGGPDED